MKLVTLLVVCVCWSSGQAGPIVDTTYGALEGTSEVNDDGEAYDAFRGVPFGAPPLGDLRFAKPVPPEAWEGVRPAQEFGDMCVQFVINANLTSEDCLFLNVYVPGGVEEAEDLPVMVWVTGGGYIFGSGSDYDPQDLIMHGPVIVVTVNYRLGPIGFLSTEDAASPGNYALWDVHAALEWVQDNIAQFGGDRDRVTLFGQSAGASITSHAAISPACQGLMHRAIMLSGASSGFFGLAYPGEVAASTNTLAFTVGCRRMNTSQEQVDCLRTVDADELDLWGFLSVVTIRLRLPNFIPVIDHDFVPQFPRASWEEGAAEDLDVMTGFTEHDAAAFVLTNLFGTNESTNLAATHQSLRLMSRAVMNHYPDVEAGLDAMYGRYEDMSDNDTDTRTIGATQAFTDWWFGAGSSQEAHLHASTSTQNTFHYNFNYRHSFLQFPEEWVEGHHSGELFSVFGEAFQREERDNRLGPFDDVDRDQTEDLMNYFTNFAYSGDPNEGPSEVEVAWPDFGDNSEMLRFRSQPAVETEDPERKADYDFWNNEFPEIARPEEEEAFGEDEELTEENFQTWLDEKLEIVREIYKDDADMLQTILNAVDNALVSRQSRLEEDIWN